MEERSGTRAYLAVGVLTIAVAVGLASTIAFFLAKERPLESTYPIDVRFSDVSGLKVGAPVLLQGAYIGRVEGVRLADPAPPAFPHSDWAVRLALRADDAELRRKLTTNSVFTIQSESVFGNKYVNATFGDTGEVLEPGRTVKGVVGAGIDARTFEKLSSALENLSGAAAELRNMLGEPGDPARPNLRVVIGNLDRTFANAAEASVTIKEALSEENQARMKQTFEDLSKAAQNLANVTERTKQGMDSWAETIERMKFWKGWFGNGEGDEKRR